MTFESKVAIITGGASGIGKSLGELLAALGATVVLADLNGDGCNAVAESIARQGHRAVARTVDVTDASAVENLIKGTAADFGQIDFVFNNAGAVTIGEVRETDLAAWNRMLDVNVRGVIHGVLAAYPLMIAQGFGHIVNTASLSGLVPSPGVVAYSTSKHAVVGLSTGLRAEAEKHGVRVSVVCPGFIKMMDTASFAGTDKATAIAQVPFKWYSTEACARDMIRGVARNRPVIIVAPHAKWLSRVYRLFPRAAQRVAAWGFARQR